MRIVVFFPTFERPDFCLQLLNDIERERKDYDVKVVVFNDGSSADYSMVKDYLKNINGDLIECPKPHGIKFLWQLFNEMYGYLWNEKDVDYFIQLQDDVRLVNNFFDRCIQSISNINADIVNISTVQSHHTAYKGKYDAMLIKGIWYFVTNFYDGVAIMTPKFFEYIDWTTPENPLSIWENNPHTGSWAGEYTSKKYCDVSHKNILQLKCSLIYHMGFESVINQYQRRLDPCISIVAPEDLEMYRELVISNRYQIPQGFSLE